MTQGASYVGLVTSHARTGSGGKGLGDFWGNCPKLSMAFNPSSVERNSSMDVSRSPLRRMTQTTQAAITIVTDEFNKKNFARNVRGRVDEVAADAATVNTTIFPTGALVGNVLALPSTNVNTVVVTDSTGSPKTLVAGVHYELDAFAGHVKLLDITTGGAYVQPFKATWKQGAVTVIAGLAVADTELWIALAGTNADDGQRGALDVYRVRLDPAKVVEYLSNDYNDFELGGSALVDTTKQANAVGGQLFKFGLPSTHE